MYYSFQSETRTISSHTHDGDSYRHVGRPSYLRVYKRAVHFKKMHVNANTQVTTNSRCATSAHSSAKYKCVHDTPLMTYSLSRSINSKQIKNLSSSYINV